MRIYLGGTTDIADTKLMAADIFFATDDCDDVGASTEDCLMLSGIEVDCCHNGKNWDCRWKGVEVECGDSIYGEDITKEQILSIIKDKKMKLRNMSGYLDFPDGDEVNVKVDYIKIVDATGEVEIPTELLDEEINYIA